MKLPTNLQDTDLALALEQAGDAILITNTDGVALYANSRHCELTGHAAEDILGKPSSFFEDKGMNQEPWKTVHQGNVWSDQVLVQRKPTMPIRIAGANPNDLHDQYWAQVTITPIRNDADEIYLYVIAHQDITEKIMLESTLEFERKGAQLEARIASILQGTNPLHDRLCNVLEILANMEEMRIEKKCGIFIANDEQTHLDMFALHGEFTDEFIEKEKQIPFGNCLCGRVAISGEIMISDDCFCDEQHENTFVGMTAHGHYIVPLRVQDHNVGVMFLYTKPYPSHDQDRLDMLKNIGHLIAQAVRNNQIEKRLISATQSAEQSSRAKSEFLANMSHEIRTPLNGILGFTEMLLREDEQTSKEEKQEWLEVIQASGKHLLQLINNILDLSKVESGEIDLEMIECDPMGILADLASIMRVHANDKMLKLNIINEGDLPRTIVTDTTRFRQILTNLIGNAIKFTEKGSVTMHTSLHDNGDGNMSLVIAITDTGMGIANEKLESIFEPFSQADSSITRNFGGTGLGLTISRNLAIALGGSLRVASMIGMGSTFAFTLPAGRKDEIQVRDNFHSESIRKSTSRTNPLSDTASLNGHVLLVDDGQTNRQLIGLILKRAGAKVTTACDGQEGFDLATTNDYDLILMDMQMPVMDGYTASTRLREEGITTPIIALTASAMVKDRERCLAAGCSDYLTKPVDIDELVEHASRWMNTPASTEHQAADTPPLVTSLPMDDPELRAIVLSYIESLPQQIQDIEEAYANEELSRLAELIHKLIGSGGMVGLDPLTQAALNVESCIHDKEIHQIKESIAQLRDVTQQAIMGAKNLPPIEPISQN